MDLKLNDNETAHLWNVLRETRIPGAVADIHAGILKQLKPEVERLSKEQAEKRKKQAEEAKKKAEVKK